MTIDTPQGTTPKDAPAPPVVTAPTRDAASAPTQPLSVEGLYVSANLALVAQRLAALETGLAKKSGESPGRVRLAIELAKVVLGGWPAFGLLFMVLFYSPIRDAIAAIPEKVRTADEIGVMGVSLKSSIKAEAEKAGALQLSKTLPSLSSAAVEFLLQGARADNPLITYSLDGADPTLVTGFWLPSQRTLDVLKELETKRLIAVHVGPPGDGTVDGLIDALGALKRRFPLREDSQSADRTGVRFELKTPTRDRPPSFGWGPTPLGKDAVNIILKAVAAQLAPSPGA